MEIVGQIDGVAVMSLLFDNSSATDPGEHLVGYKGVARLLSATDHPPTLIVLNACETLEGADEMLTAAPVVIAMSDTVGDASAAIFAAHFYGGIGAAQTIGSAMDQARAMIAIALPDEPDLAVVRTSEDVDPYDGRARLCYGGFSDTKGCCMIVAMALLLAKADPCPRFTNRDVEQCRAADSPAPTRT